MIQRHFLSRDRDKLQFLDKSVSSHLTLVLMSLLSQLVQSQAQSQVRLADSFISEVQSFTRERRLRDSDHEETTAVCVDILATLAQGEPGKSEQEDRLGWVPIYFL